MLHRHLLRHALGALLAGLLLPAAAPAAPYVYNSPPLEVPYTPTTDGWGADHHLFSSEHCGIDDGACMSRRFQRALTHEQIGQFALGAMRLGFSFGLFSKDAVVALLSAAGQILLAIPGEDLTSRTPIRETGAGSAQAMAVLEALGVPEGVRRTIGYRQFLHGMVYVAWSLRDAPPGAGPRPFAVRAAAREVIGVDARLAIQYWGHAAGVYGPCQDTLALGSLPSCDELAGAMREGLRASYRLMEELAAAQSPQAGVVASDSQASARVPGFGADLTRAPLFGLTP